MSTLAENTSRIKSATDELKAMLGTSEKVERLPNLFAEHIVDAPSVHSWADTRVTADGGTIKDGIAYVKALRGKSIKFNQLAQLEGASSRIGVKTTSQGNKIILNGTSTSEGYVAFMFRGANFQSTHKYLIRYKSEDSSKAFVSINTNPSYANKIWKGVDGGNYVVTVYSGITFTNFVLYADLIDLTEIYGSGNEPTTLLQFAQDMGYSSIDDVPYYEKTDGTIVLNCKQKSVISKDADGQTLDTLTIPTLTAFPNGLCGVGTAYDEVDLAEGKATKRFAELVLKGTETWYVGNSAKSAFKCSFSVKSASIDGSTIANAICPTYATYATNNIYNGNVGFGLNKFEIWLKDGVSESVDALKANLAANPVHIFYEVAEPTESTFTPCRAYYKASNNGQEVASAEEATAPFTAEIGYKEPTATELVTATSI